jgi:hypothetical protein
MCKTIAGVMSILNDCGKLTRDHRTETVVTVFPRLGQIHQGGPTGMLALYSNEIFGLSMFTVR